MAKEKTNAEGSQGDAPATIKVEIIKFHSSVCHEVGEVVDLHAGTAAEIIESGHAIEVK
jgi:hypothetical protein